MPYLIGIDLGTTNSALAYVDLSRSPAGQPPKIHTFPMPQLVAPGNVEPRPLLPSFLYLPAIPQDLPAGSTALPWDTERTHVVGEFARNHGSRIPGRLVTSAKSWLCHSGVDRTRPLLPWTAPPEVQRVSPVEASARYLRHMAEAWNHVMARGRDEDRLEKQVVVLTVPASFDDVARNLTIEAAKQAGLEKVTLLEEPQAAFYCWLSTRGHAEASKLKPGAMCVVVDVGGGTTDFSLIGTGEAEGELSFVREAVGDHLLLGGDNMDLALAKFVEMKLPQAGKLDAAQYGLLTQACRAAKESLLGPEPPASVPVTVMGRGSRVIGGALHTTLTPAEVRERLLEGFFPVAARDSEPQRGARAGLHEMGLPYVSDPAITRHLAAFLKRHTQARSASEGPQQPDAILFNGGVFQASPLRDRVVTVLKSWYSDSDRRYEPLVLTNPSLDLAVAWGAASFAWLKHTGGRRIGGGIARSYYIAVGEEAPRDTARGLQSVLCVLPQHLGEGEEITLEKPLLELALGEPVEFPLFTSTVRGEDRPGDLLRVAPGQLRRLPPLRTILRGGKRSVGVKQVPVRLAAKSTEIGTLEVSCVTADGTNRWRLEFNVRESMRDDDDDVASGGRQPPEAAAPSEVWPEDKVQAAAEKIRAVYVEEPPSLTPQELTKALEAALESPRHEWPSGLCRRLWEFFAEVAEARRRSPAHLARWYNLVGHCLRPGFGDPLDRYRVEQLWKLLHTPRPRLSGPPVPQLPEAGADAWIMWRRVSGGLNGALQRSLFDRLRPPLLGKASKPGANELAEMWRAAASLERIDVKQKEALIAALVRPLRKSPAPTYGFWSLTRLGARVMLYGPLNAVVHPQVVEPVLEQLLTFKPGHESEGTAWAFCMAQLARKSGQRALDVNEALANRVAAKLKTLPVSPEWARMVEEVREMESAEQAQMLGDSLPIGLRLISPGE